MKIKNWKLSLLAILFICIFSGLGYWQLSRAKQKEVLLRSFKQRAEQGPLTIDQLKNKKDIRFYSLSVEGQFDNDHTFLLDNKIYKGKIGYEIYTPFYAHGLKTPILVDRGFIPLTESRDKLPPIKFIFNTIKLEGVINLPPRYVALGQMRESAETKWPLRIEYIDLKEIGNLLNKEFFPHVLLIQPQHPAAYPLEWQIVTMPPEKHRGYAVQWFALALTLLILFVVLNFRTTD